MVIGSFVITFGSTALAEVCVIKSSLDRTFCKMWGSTSGILYFIAGLTLVIIKYEGKTHGW
jgi:hypothetical protein